MNILIAEDDAVSAMVLRKTLENLGHKVSVAEGGERAWELFQQAQFPVVISDWMMPDVDGLELCRRIRKRQSETYTYLILLTAKGQRADRLEALAAGADDFQIKPMDKDELVARLEVARRVLMTQEALSEALTMAQFASNRFSTLFLNVPVACIVYDAQGLIREWNRASEYLFGLRSEQVFEKTFWETICPPEDAEEGWEQMARVLRGDEIVNLEWRYHHPDGDLRYLLCNMFPLKGSDGNVVGAISTHTDITARKCEEERLNEQLRFAVQLNQMQEQREQELLEVNTRLTALAATDSLTGLKNRQAFQEILMTYAALAEREKMVYSLIMADVDHFKRYNDTFGHLAGDEALQCVAQVLESSIRKADIVARYGGEEFLLLLPATGLEGSLEVAERLRAALEQYPWPLQSLTASFGITTSRSGATPTRQLLEEADAALYSSKAHGRNRVTHHTRLSESLAA